MEKSRLFIAVSIVNKDTISSLISFQSNFKIKGLKIVNEFQFHFTFHFLGEIEKKKIKNIQEVLENITCPSFNIFLKYCGSFPLNKDPRIIWVGVSEGKQNLIKIQKSLIDPLKFLDIKIETREYQPHLTIARIKYLDKRSNPRIKNLLSKYKTIDIGGSVISKIRLIQSNLTPQGSIYTNLYIKDLL